jgi:single-strand DNA-binding protein
MCSFSLATTERWSKNGEKQEKTDWHRIVAFGKVAGICTQYLKKGLQVGIVGKLTTRSWEKVGQKQTITEVNALNVEFLSYKGEQSHNQTERPKPPPQQEKSRGPGPGPQEPDFSTDPSSDDGYPF